MMKTLLALVALTGTALAQAEAPDLKLPPEGTDVWGPLKPLPEVAPDVDWVKVLAGCTRRVRSTRNSSSSDRTTRPRRTANATTRGPPPR